MSSHSNQKAARDWLESCVLAALLIAIALIPTTPPDCPAQPPALERAQ